MLFELPANTECELISFTGRTQKSGPDDVPAVSFRLKLRSVSNTMLDRLSKTFRQTAYAPVEGQEQLPGVEPTTPILRSKDLKHWAPENCFEGWQVIVSRGLSDAATALRMGSCKVDDFRADLFDGGYIDLDFRVGTADIDEEGAGMLWARQKRKVFVTVIAPEMPAPAIDGTTAAFKRDFSGEGLDQALQADLLGGQDDGDWPFGDKPADAEQQADRSTESFLDIHGADGAGGPPDSDADSGADSGADSEGGETDLSTDIRADEAAEFKAGAEKAVKRGRGRRAAIASVE